MDYSNSLLIRRRDAEQPRQQADQPIQQPSLLQSGHFPSSDINRRGIRDAVATLWFSRLQICLEQRQSVRPRFVLQILVFSVRRPMPQAIWQLVKQHNWACEMCLKEPLMQIWPCLPLDLDPNPRLSVIELLYLACFSTGQPGSGWRPLFGPDDSGRSRVRAGDLHHWSGPGLCSRVRWTQGTSSPAHSLAPPCKAVLQRRKVSVWCSQAHRPIWFNSGGDF